MKIAHICVYPSKGAKHISDSGVASYTKNLLTHMPPGNNNEHFVLCSRNDGRNNTYIDGDITVIRCFDKTAGFVWQLHAQLKKLRPDVIHIQHELSLFGGLLTAYLLPILVFLWRRKTTITLHGVVSKNKIDKAFAEANNYHIPPALIKLGLSVLYWPLVHWPRRVVVHEPYFKQLLIREYGARAQKIIVIPHGVEALVPLSKTVARGRLGITNYSHIVLFMGYAAGYKGIDLLIEGFAAYAKHDPQALLLIGAGVHPKLKHDPAHLAVYEGYQKKAATHIPMGQYKWIGFIPEDQVGVYYSAADVSLYPYKMALASSGPMSFAIGYSQPFLASSAFADVFAEQFIFEPSPEALAAKLQTFFASSPDFNQHIATLRTDRLWPRTSLQTTELYKQIG